MNILIIPHLPSLYGRRYNLAKSLAQQGHEVHFVVWEMPYPLAQSLWHHLMHTLRATSIADRAGVTVHHVRRLPLFWPFINGWLFKWQIRRLHQLHGIDIILSQSFTNETEPPAGLPLIYDINDDHMAFAEVYGSALYRVAYKLLTVRRVIRRQIQRARVVSAVSDRTVAIARQYSKAVIKLPNGVESWVLDAPLGKAHKYSIVYVSTFGKWAYGVEVIGLIAKLQKSLPQLHLDLIGDGTELPAMRAAVQQLGLESVVTIHGRIDDRNKLFALISRADVCLNVSAKNAFRDAASPMKVIDYSAMGKKIVSTNLDEVVALGFPNVFIYKDSAGMAGLERALRQALAATSAPQAPRQLVRNSYTWDLLTDKLLSAWHKQEPRS